MARADIQTRWANTHTLIHPPTVTQSKMERSMLVMTFQPHDDSVSNIVHNNRDLVDKSYTTFSENPCSLTDDPVPSKTYWSGQIFFPP